MSTQPPKARQLLTRCSWSFWFVLAIGLLSLSVAVASDPANDESDKNALQPAQQRGKLYIDIAMTRSEFAAESKILAPLLKEKIAVVTQVCGLTDAQKQKLDIAGRDDNKRFLDRVGKIERQFELAEEDEDFDKLKELHDEAQLLMRGFIRPGLSTDGSLFVKSLEQLLTPEQTIKYAPLRVVFHAGGLLRLTQFRRPDEALEIKLAGTPITDDDLIFLCKLPNLKLLSLDKTDVTDEGLVQLKGAINLRELSLCDVPISDAGLDHLKGLKNLERLSLKGSRVTATGADEIQRAIPNVTVRR